MRKQKAKVKFQGRGSDNYNDYGDEAFHYEGDKIRLKCKKGFANNIAIPEMDAECECDDEGCAWKKENSQWNCVDFKTQQVSSDEKLQLQKE